jgi:hypothetical protein
MAMRVSLSVKCLAAMFLVNLTHFSGKWSYRPSLLYLYVCGFYLQEVRDYRHFMDRVKHSFNLQVIGFHSGW